MANRKTSIKDQRQNKKRRLRNLKIKRDVKKTVKTFRSSLAAKDSTQTKEMLPKIFSRLDKAAKKGIIKKNTANRRKSRLSRMLSKTA